MKFHFYEKTEDSFADTGIQNKEENKIEKNISNLSILISGICVILVWCYSFSLRNFVDKDVTEQVCDVIGVIIGSYIMMIFFYAIVSFLVFCVVEFFKYIKEKSKSFKITNYNILGAIAFFYLLTIVSLKFFLWVKFEYSYYEFLRWIVTCFSIWTVFRIKEENAQSIWLLIFAAIAIIFNPIFKLQLDVDLWDFIDFVTLIFLAIYALRKK